MMADIDTVCVVLFRKSNRAPDHAGNFMGSLARFLVEVISQAGECLFELIDRAVCGTGQPGIAEYPAVELQAMDSNMTMSVDLPLIKVVLWVEFKSEPGNVRVEMLVVMVTLDKYFGYCQLSNIFFERMYLISQSMTRRIIIHITKHNKPIEVKRSECIEDSLWLTIRSSEMPV